MDDFDEQEARVSTVFGGEIPGVGPESLAVYLEHLRANLKFPCELTGAEDFDWEEFYVYGPGDSKEYERLKKTRPSYTDRFQLTGLTDEPDEMAGLLAEVRRIADRKQFTLPLADLKAVDEASEAFRLLDDYAFWFVNFR